MLLGSSTLASPILVQTPIKPVLRMWLVSSPLLGPTQYWAGRFGAHCGFDLNAISTCAKFKIAFFRYDFELVIIKSN